ncbi:MAG: hypothetical protein C4524_09310 [Candidatus Zixiibacteriota bacterium]|nr:MAG: hypothetical protein C4524_09310 [candidate division Zixibacteria bacterium]
MAQREKSKVLEQGNIYFFYRPRVAHEGEEPVAESFDDVERFYLVLSPEGKDIHRLILIGQKKLPEIEDGGEKNWGFVAKVAQKPEELEDELGEETYETKTRGERIRPAARPAGEGVYALVQHGDHTHLAYVLELPDDLGEVQKALNIEDRGSYIFSVKNPEKGSPPSAGLNEEEKADLPENLQKKFHNRRFVAVSPPEFLDHEKTEILLIGAKEKPNQELGIDLQPEEEDEHSAEIFRDLHLRKSEHPLKPLFQGEWE